VVVEVVLIVRAYVHRELDEAEWDDRGHLLYEIAYKVQNQIESLMQLTTEIDESQVDLEDVIEV
jgi:hypothetical protein